MRGVPQQNIPHINGRNHININALLMTILMAFPNPARDFPHYIAAREVLQLYEK